MIKLTRTVGVPIKTVHTQQVVVPGICFGCYLGGRANNEKLKGGQVQPAFGGQL